MKNFRFRNFLSSMSVALLIIGCFGVVHQPCGMDQQNGIMQILAELQKQNKQIIEQNNILTNKVTDLENGRKKDSIFIADLENGRKEDRILMGKMEKNIEQLMIDNKTLSDRLNNSEQQKQEADFRIAQQAQQLQQVVAENVQLQGQNVQLQGQVQQMVDQNAQLQAQFAQQIQQAVQEAVQQANLQNTQLAGQAAQQPVVENPQLEGQIAQLAQRLQEANLQIVQLQGKGQVQVQEADKGLLYKIFVTCEDACKKSVKWCKSTYEDCKNWCRENPKKAIGGAALIVVVGGVTWYFWPEICGAVSSVFSRTAATETVEVIISDPVSVYEVSNAARWAGSNMNMVRPINFGPVGPIGPRPLGPTIYDNVIKPAAKHLADTARRAGSSI